MELDDQDLSADERRLAERLSGLAADPSPQSRAAITAAVRSAQSPRRPVIGRWRPGLAVLAAAAILLSASVGAVAASGDALPSSPTYSLRVFGEQVRIATAGLTGPAARDELQIDFAKARINQAHDVLGQGDRSNARSLLRDSRGYLTETKNDLGRLSSGEQGQIQSQLNQAEADQNQAETQLNQEGAQGG